MGLVKNVQEQGLEGLEFNFITGKVEELVNWARSRSSWGATFGLACCAIEMMSTVSPRYDIARFGAEAFRASPRQADLLILSGRVSIKMAPVVRRIYDQMLEPKWAISMGACSSSGGMFQNYAVVQGADKFMPVDVHVPGCPPRPEALLHAFMTLQQKIGQQELTGANRPRHLNAEAPSEFPVPQFGEHDLVPPNNPAVWKVPAATR